MIKLDVDGLLHKIKVELNFGNVIVCIAGRSCSGKTTLADMIQKKLTEFEPTVIHQDFWYKDLSDIKRNIYGYPDMESKDSFKIEEFKKDLLNLVANGSVRVPRYDIATNKRIAKDIEIKNSRLIIIEGLHVNDIFSKLDNDFNTIYIMLDTPIDECAIRRAKRDTELFNISYDRVINRYKDILVPCYEKWYNKQMEITKSKFDKGLIIYD